MEKTILITGFDPFGGETINPSWEAVSRLPDTVQDISVVPLLLPTEFRAAWKTLENAIQKHKPRAVISTGLAEGRSHISLEKVAVNIADARIPDNAGVQPCDELIASMGPDAYFATIPLRKIEAELHQHRIPARLSYSAGTYVCNYIFYNIRHNYPELPAGFVHVPYTEDQVLQGTGSSPFMQLESIIRALELIIPLCI